MSRKNMTAAVLIMVCAAFVPFPVFAKTDNLLVNPYADDNRDFWITHGDAVTEEVDGDTCFVIRNGGSFHQYIDLPADSASKVVLLIGTALSELINPDGAITGLPYLYGYMLEGEFIYSYLHVFSRNYYYLANHENDWVTLWGIFYVPENTKRLQFMLRQAEQYGVPHNGSAARFDDLGVYLFASPDEARAFVNEYY